MRKVLYEKGVRVRLPGQIYEQLVAQAEDRSTTISQVIRDILRAHYQGPDLWNTPIRDLWALDALDSVPGPRPDLESPVQSPCISLDKRQEVDI